jgi:DNA polymerase III delta prime subunit
VGKTTAAKVLAQEAGYAVFELNASDARSAKAMRKVLPGAQVNIIRTSSGASVVDTQMVIIMDEVDGVDGKVDGGVAKVIGEIVRGHQYPLMMIANDVYGKPVVKELFAAAVTFAFYRPRACELAKRLLAIAHNEAPPGKSDRPDLARITLGEAQRLADACGGDMRQAITYMECWGIKRRPGQDGPEQDVGLFDVVKDLWRPPHRR